jgi:hypothetical protein
VVGKSGLKVKPAAYTSPNYWDGLVVGRIALDKSGNV